MKDTKIIKLLIIICISLIVLLCGTIIVLNKKNVDEDEIVEIENDVDESDVNYDENSISEFDIDHMDDGGVTYDRTHLDSFELNITNMNDKLKSKIKNYDEFYIELKEYLYLNGLVESDNIKVTKYEEDESTLNITFDILDEQNTNVFVSIDLERNNYEFSDNYEYQD